jgi:hypothetical protein
MRKTPFASIFEIYAIFAVEPSGARPQSDSIVKEQRFGSDKIGSDAPLGAFGQLKCPHTSNQRSGQYSNSLCCQIIRTTKNLRNQQRIDAVTANGAEPFHETRKPFLLLLGEKAGMRASVSSDFANN